MPKEEQPNPSETADMGGESQESQPASPKENVENVEKPLDGAQAEQMTVELQGELGNTANVLLERAKQAGLADDADVQGLLGEFTTLSGQLNVALEDFRAEAAKAEEGAAKIAAAHEAMPEIIGADKVEAAQAKVEMAQATIRSGEDAIKRVQEGRASAEGVLDARAKAEQDGKAQGEFNAKYEQEHPFKASEAFEAKRAKIEAIKDIMPDVYEQATASLNTKLAQEMAVYDKSRDEAWSNRDASETVETQEITAENLEEQLEMTAEGQAAKAYLEERAQIFEKASQQVGDRTIKAFLKSLAQEVRGKVSFYIPTFQDGQESGLSARMTRSRLALETMKANIEGRRTLETYEASTKLSYDDKKALDNVVKAYDNQAYMSIKTNLVEAGKRLEQKIVAEKEVA